MRISAGLSTSALAIATSLMILVPSTASAQDAPADTAPQTAANQPAEVAAADIVVTGSRVALNGNDQPTPVTVVSIEQMQDVKPTTVAEQLNEMPQFSGSQTQNTPQGSGSANTGNSNPSGNVLNLRNFGATRNLILYDGHRVAPNSGNGTVDVDLIPQLLLKRVDVVTGGVSAVYGADAVTGVVNFVTDTKFRGLKVNAQAGISTHGDGGQQRIGAAWGGSFLEDRAHLLASYEFFNDEGIGHRSDRKWGAARYQFGQVSSATNTGVTPSVTTITSAFVSRAARQQNSFGGTITPAVGGGTLPASFLNVQTTPYNANPQPLYTYFIQPGVLAPASGTFVNSNVVANGTGGYFDTSLRAALRMHQAFGRFDFDVADNVHFYARGAYTDTKNSGYGIPNPTYIPNSGNFAPVFVKDPTTGAPNPYLPAAIYNQLNAAGVTKFLIGKLYGGPAQDQYRQFTQTFGRNWSADVGFNGEFGNGWKWEASYIHSDNHQRTVGNNAVNGRKVSASLDAVNDGGTIKCFVNTAAGQALLNTSPNAAALRNFYSGCVPQSTIFGPTILANEADWIFDPITVVTNIKMDDVEGYISGSPFSTWAGPVNVALSAQGRKQKYEVISGSNPATIANPLDCTGLRLTPPQTATNQSGPGAEPYRCTPTSLEYFQAESYGRSPISVGVKEVALEASVPLLNDTPFFQSLTVTGAGRYTDYSTTGGIWSWKAGLDWAVTDDLSFRATRSRDIRAPTLHELYQPLILVSFNGTDVLLNKSLQSPLTPAGVFTQGNANLQPEKGDTLTIGAVYKPSFLPGFSIAIDYFDIKVKDAIVTLNGQDQTTQADCISSGGASETCSLIVRPIDCCTTKTDANAATRFFSSPINIATQYTRGVDLELNYVTRVANRPFGLRLLTTYQPENVYIDGVTRVKYNNAGSGLAIGTTGNVGAGAKWRGTLIANMEVADGVRFSLQERYRGPLKFIPEITSSSTTAATQYVLLNAPSKVDAKFYTNVNLAFRTGLGEFYVNVQNLFDTQPAPWASINSALPGNNGVAPGDDPIGRYYTAGVRLKF